MAFFDLVDSVSSITSDRADEREEYHGVEHTRPAVMFTYPADERSLNERANRAEAVDESDNGRGCIPTVHLAQFCGKRATLY